MTYFGLVIPGMTSDAEYAAALLFAAEPTDRALTGWAGWRTAPRWLEAVARMDEYERTMTPRRSKT